MLLNIIIYVSGLITIITLLILVEKYRNRNHELFEDLFGLYGQINFELNKIEKISNDRQNNIDIAIKECEEAISNIEKNYRVTNISKIRLINFLISINCIGKYDYSKMFSKSIYTKISNKPYRFLCDKLRHQINLYSKNDETFNIEYVVNLILYLLIK